MWRAAATGEEELAGWLASGRSNHEPGGSSWNESGRVVEGTKEAIGGDEVSLN